MKSIEFGGNPVVRVEMRLFTKGAKVVFRKNFESFCASTFLLVESVHGKRYGINEVCYRADETITQDMSDLSEWLFAQITALEKMYHSFDIKKLRKGRSPSLYIKDRKIILSHHLKFYSCLELADQAMLRIEVLEEMKVYSKEEAHGFCIDIKRKINRLTSRYRYLSSFIKRYREETKANIIDKNNRSYYKILFINEIKNVNQLKASEIRKVINMNNKVSEELRKIREMGYTKKLH